MTGVSGGVGSLAVGIGTRLGGDVTAVGSGAGLEMARAMVLTRTRTHMVAVTSTTADLDDIGRWLVDGLAAPIDSAVAVRDVAAGLERLRAGQARGRIVVDVEGGFWIRPGRQVVSLGSVVAFPSTCRRPFLALLADSC